VGSLTEGDLTAEFLTESLSARFLSKRNGNIVCSLLLDAGHFCTSATRPSAVRARVLDKVVAAGRLRRTALPHHRITAAMGSEC